MESASTYWADRANLEWQIELGADEAIGDTPIDRYALDPAPEKKAEKKPEAVPEIPTAAPQIDVVALAKQAAAAATDLPSLRAAMDNFEHCALKAGARQLVFSDGTPGARVMIIGEAPGRDEDRMGKSFVGGAGQLLDKMLAAIGLDRDTVYLTNVLPWRPPQNREPEADEMAMMLPFLMRHIELAAPEFIVIMGNSACQALLNKRGITRLRGHWETVAGQPALPMFHPAYLLRTPSAKREAWADLLDLKARLKNAD